MEQILNKLSEIEITAQRIMEDAGRSKAALSAEMEQQCRNFDAELEQETNRKIQELKDNLEAQKDQELTSLRHRTEQQLEDLDTYYTSSWRKTYSNSFSDTERGDPIWEDSFPTAEYQQRSVPCRVN